MIYIFLPLFDDLNSLVHLVRKIGPGFLDRANSDLHKVFLLSSFFLHRHVMVDHLFIGARIDRGLLLFFMRVWQLICAEIAEELLAFLAFEDGLP